MRPTASERFPGLNLQVSYTLTRIGEIYPGRAVARDRFPGRKFSRPTASDRFMMASNWASTSSSTAVTEATITMSASNVTNNIDEPIVGDERKSAEKYKIMLDLHKS